MRKRPTLREVQKILSEEIEMYRSSYTDLFGPTKGRITDKAALRTISGLTEAKRLLRPRQAFHDCTDSRGAKPE